MKSINTLFLLALSLFATTAAAIAGQNSFKRYPLHAYGEIEFTVPSGWKDEIRQPPDNLPPFIRFTAPGDKSMAMLVTLVWPDRPDIPMPDAKWMKAKLDEAKNGIRDQAVEKSIPTEKFTGSSGDGYYFTATNSSPEKDGFKYMTHGMLRIGNLLASFTILNNEGSGSLAEEGLTVLQRAVHHQTYKK